ncbi:hypothetical protein AMTR_s00083p00105420 [Amborella trichopoda]|uniref:Uncharacterized protein n=1 Tax=Amborella trichopoda TaxID=13333 RepID=W1P6B9_AMBTC|nr:hypothetical protein AMTR_s00083p00105420 [Amborella trichopoda]
MVVDKTEALGAKSEANSKHKEKTNAKSSRSSARMVAKKEYKGGGGIIILNDDSRRAKEEDYNSRSIYVSADEIPTGISFRVP